jgi:Sulfotransferase family
MLFFRFQSRGVPKYWKVERAPVVGAINAVGRMLGPWAGPALIGERLLKEARRQTGLHDFGEPSFDKPFFRLVASMKAESRLNLIGWLATRQDLLRLLINRLRLEADRKLHPAVDEMPIQRPVFITGLPRTGTTLLHRLLALDPRARVALTWETMYPCPPLAAGSNRIDPCARRVERQLRWFHRMLKHFNRIHPIDAYLPEECLIIFSHSFLSYQFETTHRLPAYLDWLLTQDLRPAYQIHKRILQHLQLRCPKAYWVLKAPAHLFDLEALFSIYPDACVIMTHRDPVEVSASNASLTATLRSAFSDEVDLAELGPECSRRWAEAVTRAMHARDSGRVPAERCLDLYYVDLLSDPVGTVKKVYARFELPFPEDLEEKIHLFLQANPKNRCGRHRYRLEDFGLTIEEEKSRYAAYRERFRL